MNDVLLIGPYIGDWKNELLTFRPYANWIFNQLDKPICYISSHFNRKFLYDWIPEENFIPVFEHLTRNESKQNNYLHDDITAKDYKLLIKEFKKTIIEKEKITSKNINIYNLSYLESKPEYSWHQKIFTKIKIEPIPNNYIIYIPDSSISTSFHDTLLCSLLNEYDNIAMVGDHTCYDIEKFLNFQINYSEVGYENLMKYILGCKFVITPCSHWTFLCNVHKIPVVSWGLNGNIYKKDNVYGFDNNNYILIDKKMSNVLNSIKYFYKKTVGDKQ